MLAGFQTAMENDGPARTAAADWMPFSLSLDYVLSNENFYIWEQVCGDCGWWRMMCELGRVAWMSFFFLGLARANELALHYFSGKRRIIGR